MQALPSHPTAPKLSPRHVTLADLADLGPSAAESDALVTEQRVAVISLDAHASEFVELASLDVASGSMADSDWYRTNWVDVQFTGVDAANACLTESGVKRIGWRQCRLTGFSASGCTLQDVAFDDCRLQMANLRFANLQRVGFAGCDLSGADFSNARLADVTFEDCTFDGATFTQAQCTRVLLAGGSLSGIRGLDGLRGATFRLDSLDEIAQEMAVALGFTLVDVG